ncbi:phytoene desaturase family protein [soil metagenome]
MPAARERVLVIGAGVGGLAAALELAAQGVDVLVLERGAQPGGKMREVNIAGVGMDAGPTVFTMRWVFEELFERVGARLGDWLTLQPADVLARHAWSENERLDLFADIARSADAIGRFAGSAEARGYLAFCDRARRIYRTLETPFLRGTRPTPVSLATRVGWRGLPDLMRISPMATMWGELGRYFADPRLRQLFGRYATYCGSSPFQAPATLMLVAHVEQDGVWMVEGGMHRVALALAALAARFGAQFRYGSHVEEIIVRNDRAAGVRLSSGEQIDASAVVFNGDVAALAATTLGAGAARAVPPADPHDRSLSAITWNLLAPAQGFPLLRHTVFFSADYRAEFASLFGRRELPASPTVYVCAQDRADSDDSPANSRRPERLMCLVNAPARGDGTPFTSTELTRCEARTFETLARCGLQIQRSPRTTTMTTPADFEQLFPATGGALYGQASHGWKASFTRPGSRSRLPGLYLAGGSTHPGPGVPMAALSGRLAAASLLCDRPPMRTSPHRSTQPWPPAATPGGTSTP